MRINCNIKIAPPEKTTDSICLSIIVPVYNAETCIVNCINSILAIKNCNLDIILVDDGSTDSSGKICDKYSDKMDCIRTLHKTNGGVASARNAGLNLAKGNWILFADADDLVLDGITNCKLNQDADLICFNWIYNDNQVIEHIEDAILCDHKLHTYLSLHMSQFRFRCPWGKLFYRQIIEKYNLRYDESLFVGEDTIFVLDYLKHCKKLQLISSTAYQYTRPQPLKREIPLSYSKSYIAKFLDKYKALGIPCIPLLMQQEYYFFEEAGDASFKGWIKRERCKEVRNIQDLCWKEYNWRRKMKILAYRIISKLKE